VASGISELRHHPRKGANEYPFLITNRSCFQFFVQAADGAEHRTRDAIAEVAKAFNLTDAELAQLNPSGMDYVFANRFGWARTYLKKAGLIRYTAWGKFQITDAGRALLTKNPSKIDLSVLKQYPEFLEFYGGAKPDEGVASTGTQSGTDEADETPEELIASAHATLRKLVQTELLAKIITGTPKFFERLVVNLLTTMGYGGSLADAGQALGKPHDGGIDGVIKEDKLGLDLIYLQAKKWKDSTVGSNEVQSFVGALAGVKARRGVFITTSKFSKEAVAYAASLENRVILIDGDRLTELMFEYGLGVSTFNTYAVKRVDNDFFDEDEI
jgi:restriction system protein